jgi:dTDP-4-amino-4,6-dideoxygalactose transaminase
MRSKFLPFSPPLIEEDEIAEVVDTLRSEWITTGPKVRRFEDEFAAFIGAPAALALNSCTAALHVALVTLGIGPGDAVITTTMTFCSSVHVIEHIGAFPILVDVEYDTLNIDPKKIEAAIESNIKKLKFEIKALLPVHLYGHPCDMKSILEISRIYNLVIIEDAAHALPAKYEGCYIGRMMPGDENSQSQIRNAKLTCFSFYATKNITTAEGGMLTGQPDLIEEARIWSLHGMSRDAWKRYSSQGSWYYEVIRPGFKYNMTDIQAAIGLHQLRKLPQFQARRREIARRYNEAFSQLEELQIPTERPEVEHAWHLYVLRLNLEMLKIDRARFIEELKARNIGTSVHFIPIHLHSYYRNRYGYKPEDFPVAFREYQRIISLPLYPRMSDQDVEDVIEAVIDVVKLYRK